MNIRPALVLAVFATTACVQTTKYPDSWERLPLVTGDFSCPAISGVYDNSGTRPDGKKVSLAVWLSGATGRTKQEAGNTAQNRFVGQLSKSQLVELQLVQNSQLVIRAKGEDFLTEWQISKSDRKFDCSDGALVIPTGGNESGDNVLAFSAGTIKLFPGDTHLMVNSSGTIAGVLLFVPAVAHQDNWARFSRVK